LTFTKAFVEHVVEHLVGPDEKTSDAILAAYVDPFFEEKKTTLQSKLQEILLPYTSGFGLSLEKEFHAQVSRNIRQRHADSLVGRLEEQHPDLFQPNPGEGLNRTKLLRVVRGLEGPETDQFCIRKVMIMMTAHYKMSLRTFVDNVINLAVESCLVRDIPDVLTPRKVGEMNSDRLKQLASESEELQERRQTLQEQVDILRDALRVCNKLKPREPTGEPIAAGTVLHQTDS
jgi:hypothetical protein